MKAKIVRKPLISTFLCLLHDFLSVNNDANVPPKSDKQKNLEKKLVYILKVTDEKRWIRGRVR
jgi:hypothetical protein